MPPVCGAEAMRSAICVLTHELPCATTFYAYEALLRHMLLHVALVFLILLLFLRHVVAFLFTPPPAACHIFFFAACLLIRAKRAFAARRCCHARRRLRARLRFVPESDIAVRARCCHVTPLDAAFAVTASQMIFAAKEMRR